MSVEVEELASSPHYRLLSYQSYWKKYAVIESGERYLVTRFSLDRASDLDTVNLLENLEDWRNKLRSVAEQTSCFQPIEKIVPHAEGIDLFEKMPLGIPLGTLIFRSGALNAPFVASILAEVARSLDCLHREGLYHFCLNLDRIIIDDQGKIRIIDVGLVHHLQSIYGPQTFPNPFWEYVHPHPSYVPPELLKGSLVGAQTDIFALGALTFQLLTGSTAYVGADDMEVYSMIKTGERPKIRSFRAELGPRIEVAIHQALSPHPHERSKTALLWIEEAFGKLEKLDDIKLSSTRYVSLLNDWFYDAYFKTVAEPRVVDPLVAALLDKADLDQPSQPLEHVFETMRTTRSTRVKSGKFVFYMTGFSVVFTVIALGLLYVFMRL